MGRPNTERDRILGVTRVARFLDEHDCKVPIKNSSAGFILSDQKTYGLWGLYTVASRKSGLLADGPVGLTDWARDFVEQQYLPRLRSHESKLINLIHDGGTLKAHKGQQPFQCFADILRPDFTVGEVGFYGAALRDAERVERPRAPERQKQLAALIREHLNPDTAMGRDDIRNLAFSAEQTGAVSLADKLQRILRVEALLAPAEALFELMLARNGQVPSVLASKVADHWGSRVPNLNDPIAPLMSDIRTAVGDDQAHALQRCDLAFADGNYEDAIHALLELNGLVMEARGAGPWVKLNAGELDVRYRGIEQELPSGEELELLWRNSYFIDALKDITFELERRR